MPYGTSLMVRAHRALLGLAAPRWMLAFFIFAAVSALVSIRYPDAITTAWVPPLAMFAVSLLAAIATNARFRRDPLLLGLHLGLLALVVMIALARLTYLDGMVSLTDGTTFPGQLDVDRRGPLHPGHVERLRFSNEGFIEDYTRADRWRTTRNQVRWWDAQGTSHFAEIGDDEPLVLGAYRIYTTFNRGYSPVLIWHPSDGLPQQGTVQLRADTDFGQANEWQPQGGPPIWIMLETDEPVALQRGQRRHNLGASGLRHSLVVRTGNLRETMRPGDTLDLPGGRLTYVELGTWMGYRVVYDYAMYWIASSAAVVVLCMIAFYARLLRRNDIAHPLRGDEACA